MSDSNGTVCVDGTCAHCRSDAQFLKRRTRPATRSGGSVVRIADLFAGCGGMSLGFEEAARRDGKRFEVALAADLDSQALEVYKANFPDAWVLEDDVSVLFSGVPGSPLSVEEKAIGAVAGRVDALVGGPPCQGHSNLNNHTRRRDPKNALYLRMARAAEVLSPKIVVIENVVAVQKDEGRIVEKTRAALEDAEYVVADRVIDLVRVGVPQRRRRHLMLASKVPCLDPKQVLDDLATAKQDHPKRTVQWAIDDLRDANGGGVFDSASHATDTNASRIKYLFDHGLYNLPNDQRPDCHQSGKHSYVSIYGRLQWKQPAQTITTGFGSMGQGRYVHPSQRRTITPHEAARLQTFPDWFDFGEDRRRTVLASMIGNAVPPLLMVALGAVVVPKIGELPVR